MKQVYKLINFTILALLFSVGLSAQSTIKGKVVDAETGEDLVGAAVVIQGIGGGANTDYNGEFIIKATLPVRLKITYTGYTPSEISVSDAAQRIEVRLSSSSIVMEELVIKGQRIDDKQKAAPLTVENLDAIAIKETAAVSFYNGLGNLKGVDMTTASLGFTVINTRGFNSTSPVRSLQIIDGVDNQAPGLNFSLGNFLGASDLDVQKVDLIVGASSSFYGPNAFNGVISMETKNPFFNKGLAVSLKAGERELLEGALRYADVIKNKSGRDFMAYKVNFFGLRANDWVADNYDPISGSAGNSVFGAAQNPGRFNAVNVYGDENNSSYAFELGYNSRAGLNTFNRTGYKEKDLVDYDTRNIKTSAALHFRTNPKKEFESPELILSSNFGTGTTVYQGDNRFSLRDILFVQNRLEFRKRDKFFLRVYSTNEDAGNSFDPYFTALQMQKAAATNDNWRNSYTQWWQQNGLGDVFDKMRAAGYGVEGQTPELLTKWQRENQELLAGYHQQAEAYANSANKNNNAIPFFEPGTARYDSLFNAITARKNNDPLGGTRFYDKSALYHAHGEYKFHPSFLRELVVGANVRAYRPVSDGTIFSDSITRIKNNEFGAYLGAEKEVGELRFSATARVDKNQNFNYLATPAASVVWIPSQNNYLRFSFSSAIRNPTLSDQYLNLNVGPATLVGNLNGFNNLVPLDSFNLWRENPNRGLTTINLDPIRPEKVKTFEVGYRTTLFEKIYVDAGYYYNFYNDFIGYNIGVTVPFDTVEVPGLPPFPLPNLNGIEAWRVASNARERVTTQGIAVGANYYFKNYYMIAGNYSWNRLNTKDTDPIVPAFNTPEHKFNVTLSARDIPLQSGRRGGPALGFSINFKWIDNFIFEGSPQFTGVIPSYQLLDAQVNVNIPKLNTTFKLGASNLLNNKQFQVYGGPRIGRMAYLAVIYDYRKK